jgi:ATPase subunit of ABC transporter with duplicated ATPase domains
LLDEPTNHLDIEGQEALEDELLQHQASCLLVSHDRNFVRTVGSRFWLIEKKKLVELEGPRASSRRSAQPASSCPDSIHFRERHPLLAIMT